MSLDQPAPHTGKSFLGKLSIGDVQARSDVTGKLAIGVESRHTDIVDPTVLSVITTDAILHLKRSMLIKGLGVGFQGALQVFLVYFFQPAISELCIKQSPGEL